MMLPNVVRLLLATISTRSAARSRPVACPCVKPGALAVSWATALLKLVVGGEPAGKRYWVSQVIAAAPGATGSSMK